jgi:hypothetical protein
VQQVAWIWPSVGLYVHFFSRMRSASGHFQQTIRAQRPPRLSASRHHQDCHDRPRRISASPANEIVALASRLKADLGNRSGIVD